MSSPGPGKYDPPNLLSDNEYQILLEDIDQAVAEGNRRLPNILATHNPANVRI